MKFALEQHDLETLEKLLEVIEEKKGKLTAKVYRDILHKLKAEKETMLIFELTKTDHDLLNEMGFEAKKLDENLTARMGVEYNEVFGKLKAQLPEKS